VLLYPIHRRQILEGFTPIVGLPTTEVIRSMIVCV